MPSRADLQAPPPHFLLANTSRRVSFARLCNVADLQNIVSNYVARLGSWFSVTWLSWPRSSKASVPSFCVLSLSSCYECYCLFMFWFCDTALRSQQRKPDKGSHSESVKFLYNALIHNNTNSERSRFTKQFLCERQNSHTLPLPRGVIIRFFLFPTQPAAWVQGLHVLLPCFRVILLTVKMANQQSQDLAALLGQAMNANIAPQFQDGQNPPLPPSKSSFLRHVS